MTIAEFDKLDPAQKKAILLQCCGSVAWADKIIEALPAEDLIDLFQIAEDQWYACSKEDWREAFSHHPKMGDEALAEANKQYEERFGYVFILYAAGKSPNEVLARLQSRLTNSPEEELQVAADEQLKITRSRLEKLFTN